MINKVIKMVTALFDIPEQKRQIKLSPRQKRYLRQARKSDK